MTHPFTRSNYVKNIVWLVVVASLFVVSAYKCSSTLHAKPSPALFFGIFAFALFLTCIRIFRRILAIRRGLFNGISS